MDTSKQDWDTFRMWVERIPGYAYMKRDSRKRAKETWKKMNTDQTHPNWVQGISRGVTGYTSNVTAIEDDVTNSLLGILEDHSATAAKMSMADFNRARNALKAAQYEKEQKGAAIQKYMGWALKKEEKENTMSTISVNTNDRQEQQVRYLRDRLERVLYSKELEARRFFGLIDDEAPKTAKELVERIKADNFVISKFVAEYEDDEEYEGSYYTAMGHIRWRSPDKKRDPDGYKEWSEVNTAAYDRIKDAIFVLEPAEGLKALQTYEDAPIQ